MNKTEFSKILKEINIAYGDKKFPLTEESVSVWLKYLGDYEYNEVLQSVEAHIKTSIYPPVIAELIQYVEQFRKSQRKKSALEKQIYLSVIAAYPLARDKESTRALYEKITGGDLYKANAILQEVKNAVAEWERCGEIEPPTLDNFLARLLI